MTRVLQKFGNILPRNHNGKDRLHDKPVLFYYSRNISLNGQTFVLFICYNRIKGTIVYAVAVSLGNNISDDNYSGEVEPVNIHIPFFLGIFHEFLNRCLGIKKYLDRENNHARETISRCQSAIDHENNRWFFTDYNRIDQCAKQIQAENLNIAENEKQLQKYRTLLNAVANELVRSSAFFKMFLDGKETEFTPPSELNSI